MTRITCEGVWSEANLLATKGWSTAESVALSDTTCGAWLSLTICAFSICFSAKWRPVGLWQQQCTWPKPPAPIGRLLTLKSRSAGTSSSRVNSKSGSASAGAARPLSSRAQECSDLARSERALAVVRHIEAMPGTVFAAKIVLDHA